MRQHLSGDTFAMDATQRDKKENHMTPKNYDEPESHHRIVTEERIRNAQQNPIQ